jgi:nicotinamide-nucleotide amidase
MESICITIGGILKRRQGGIHVMEDQTLQDLSLKVGTALGQQELVLASAESCTGGWLGQSITSVAGSSAWYERGFITYSNIAKQEMLGVNAKTLE